MKNNTILLLVSFILLSCNQERAALNYLTLSVNLDQSALQYDEVFSYAEVIPLETTDSSLIVYPFEAIEHKGNLYIYDLHLVKTFVFGKNGEFIQQIGRMGQGPGEYNWLHTISIDKKNDILHLVEPIGKFHNFTLNGEFIETKKYPDGNVYHCIHHLDDYIVLWSPPINDEDDCIIILDSQTMKTINTYEKGPLLLQEGKFYSYNDELFFFKYRENLVQKVTKDSLTAAFQWDFDKDNLEIHNTGFSFDESNYQEEKKLLSRYMEEGTIPYLFVAQAQNDNYYYACLRYQYKYDKSIFYRKKDGKYLVFGEESWHMPINALVFTDDYMIILLNSNNHENFKPFLAEAERKKLEALTEDDNPCLLKLYFKKCE